MNVINASGWKPEMNAGSNDAPATFTGNRALMLEEPLIFEIGDAQTTGVDFEPVPAPPSRLDSLLRECVPLAAGVALAGPFRVNSAAGLADVAGDGLSHGFSRCHVEEARAETSHRDGSSS